MHLIDTEFTISSGNEWTDASVGGHHFSTRQLSNYLRTRRCTPPNHRLSTSLPLITASRLSNGDICTAEYCSLNMSLCPGVLRFMDFGASWMEIRNAFRAVNCWKDYEYDYDHDYSFLILTRRPLKHAYTLLTNQIINLMDILEKAGITCIS